MQEIRFTLVADGSSDKTLLRVIKWLMDDLYPQIPNSTVFADFRELPVPPKSLGEKIDTARHYYPFDVLCIHRDAESTKIKTIQERRQEIKDKIGEHEFEKTVCVIPVKMMETWLMIDKEAIKKAAGNRNYSGVIDLPAIRTLEKESQPKITLHEVLKQASGLKGRNLQKFNVDKAVHRVAENITDFSPLRQLEAFKVFESEVKTVIDKFLLLSDINI